MNRRNFLLSALAITAPSLAITAPSWPGYRIRSFAREQYDLGLMSRDSHRALIASTRV